jgi:outer membrane protein OmpA-like peptidoglycan-associated protein
MSQSSAVNVPRRSQTSQIQSLFLVALVLSFLGHAGFLVWSRTYKLHGLRESSAPMLLPPKFVVRQANIDPRTLQDAPEPAKPVEKTPPKVDAIVFEDSKPKAMDVRMEAKPVELAKPLIEEKPRSAPTTASVESVPAAKLGALDAELGSLAGGFLQSTPVSKAQPVLAMGKGDPKGSVSGVDQVIPGRQSLDKALENIGLVRMDTPVAIPGSALFGYDSADLGPESLPVLEKIADLRRRFPEYTMVITGHTDALGGTEYNQTLSLRRAEAVKEWLVRRYKMDPSKLETSGRGPGELLVPGDRSVEEQGPNRRVEVILRPPSPVSPGSKIAPRKTN